MFVSQVMMSQILKLALAFLSSRFPKLRKTSGQKFKYLNDTHRKKLFYSIQYKNGFLAASIFSICLHNQLRFYTFHYQVQMFENVIYKIESKNKWLLLSASLQENLGWFLS